MYDNNFNRYGSTLQRPGGVDIDELRRRRASMDSRMSPMPVTERPEPIQPPPQQESGVAQAIRQFSQMAATGLMGQAGDRSDASPASGSQARQMPGLDQMRTPPFVPTTTRPPAVQAPALPAIQPIGAAEPPRMTRMPPQEAAPTQPAMPQAAPPAPIRPDPRVIAQQEAAARTSSVDPIAQAQEQAGASSKRGFWDILKTAGVGALQGLASGGGLGGALGGALAGGAMGVISPRAGGEYRFNVLQRPRMEQDMARRMQQEQFRRQQEAASLAGQKTAAEIQKLQAEAESLPGREALNRENIQSNIDYRKSRMQQPAAQPPLSRIVVPGKNGPEQKFVRPEEGATYPAYERPRAGRGGGGDGEGGERLTRSALNLEAETENKRLLAEELMSQLNAPQGLDEFEMADLRIRAEKALREYNNSVRKLGLTYGERYETGPGRTPEGKSSPFMYYKRR